MCIIQDCVFSFRFNHNFWFGHKYLLEKWKNSYVLWKRVVAKTLLKILVTKYKLSKTFSNHHTIKSNNKNGFYPNTPHILWEVKATLNIYRCKVGIKSEQQFSCQISTQWFMWDYDNTSSDRCFLSVLFSILVFPDNFAQVWKKKTL